MFDLPKYHFESQTDVIYCKSARQYGIGRVSNYLSDALFYPESLQNLPVGKYCIETQRQGYPLVEETMVFRKGSDVFYRQNGDEFIGKISDFKFTQENGDEDIMVKLESGGKKHELKLGELAKLLHCKDRLTSDIMQQYLDYYTDMEAKSQEDHELSQIQDDDFKKAWDIFYEVVKMRDTFVKEQYRRCCIVIREWLEEKLQWFESNKKLSRRAVRTILKQYEESRSADECNVKEAKKTFSPRYADESHTNAQAYVELAWDNHSEFQLWDMTTGTIPTSDDNILPDDVLQKLSLNAYAEAARVEIMRRYKMAEYNYKRQIVTIERSAGIVNGSQLSECDFSFFKFCRINNTVKVPAEVEGWFKELVATSEIWANYSTGLRESHEVSDDDFFREAMNDSDESVSQISESEKERLFKRLC
jgi:hypothetical protein